MPWAEQRNDFAKKITNAKNSDTTILPDSSIQPKEIDRNKNEQFAKKLNNISLTNYNSSEKVSINNNGDQPLKNCNKAPLNILNPKNNDESITVVSRIRKGLERNLSGTGGIGRKLFGSGQNNNNNHNTENNNFENLENYLGDDQETYYVRQCDFYISLLVIIV